MSLDLTCPHCDRLFRPSAEQAGKLAACPHCSRNVRIPTGESRPPPTVEQGDHRWKNPSTIWYVQAEDGKQYGPVSGEQLHGWYEEGRITADCQLLRKGAGQWQWATDLYPDLEEAAQLRPLGPAENKALQPQRVAEPPRPPEPPRPVARPAPTQSATQITPLSPTDFPTAGAGLKALGPVRPVSLGLEQLEVNHEAALENRRKFAPHMVAHADRAPLHRMVMIVAITNFAFGGVRAILYFSLMLNMISVIGSFAEGTERQAMMRAAVSLAIAFLMLVLNITIVSGGIGLLQQREWGRTATFTGTIIGLVVQLTGVCVTMLLGSEGSGLARVMWVLLLVLLLPSIAYDAFAAGALAMPGVADNLEE